MEQNDETFIKLRVDQGIMKERMDSIDNSLKELNQSFKDFVTESRKQFALKSDLNDYVKKEKYNETSFLLTWGRNILQTAVTTAIIGALFYYNK